MLTTSSRSHNSQICDLTKATGSRYASIATMRYTMAREYFKCFHSYREKCKKLSDQELGRLFRALMEYSEAGTAPELTGRESIAFDFIADEIDRDKSAYSETCRKNRENGAKATERYRPLPTATERGPEEPKGTQIDKVEGKRTIKETLPIGSAKKTGGAVFSPPTVEMVKAYCQERGNRVDHQRFVDFYASKGWKVGNQPMKDWKAAVRTWEQREDTPRTRERNTLKNYNEAPNAVEEIKLDLEEL